MIPGTCMVQSPHGAHLEMPAVPLEAKVAHLTRPDTYSEQPTAVEVIQTHMSFVFLTDRHAYKLKKPVRYEFLDFSTLEARHADCLEEVRLNRRLARDVYLDVTALTRGAGGALRLGGEGKAVEWLVRMRRLPRELMLDRAISAERATVEDVRRFMLVLTHFYRRAEPVVMDAARYLQRFEHDIRANHRELLGRDYDLPRTLVEAITTHQLDTITHDATLLEQRAAEGRIVEGHGDLRPEHVFLGREPVFIDCLEFSRDWRLLDPVEEIAYLGLECEHAGAAWIGEAALEIYSERTGDAPAVRLLRFYKSVRASLRAKLSVWHLRDHLDSAAQAKWRQRARRYLELASRYAAP